MHFNDPFFSVIHVFDLMPGASRQNEVTTCHTKTTVQQIAVSRAGTIDDQYMVFIDTNRDIFCTSLKNGSNFEIYKIGMRFDLILLMKNDKFSLKIDCVQELKYYQRCGQVSLTCWLGYMMYHTAYGIAQARLVWIQQLLH